MIAPERQAEINETYRRMIEADLRPVIRETFLLLSDDGTVAIATIWNSREALEAVVSGHSKSLAFAAHVKYVLPYPISTKGVRVAAKVLINLATGMEDAERVTVAFLVATAALEQGKSVVVWATKDAVRLALPGEATGEACAGCPPLERLFQQFTIGGGELWLCPICLNARGLADAEKTGNVKVAGATPMWEWVGEDTTVFSY